MLILLVVFSSIGVLLALIARRMIAGKVPPNAWYGFHARGEPYEPALWYRVNRRAGWWQLAVGLLCILAALALYPFCTPDEDRYAILFTLVTLPVLMLGLLDSLRYERKLR